MLSGERRVQDKIRDHFEFRVEKVRKVKTLLVQTVSLCDPT